MLLASFYKFQIGLLIGCYIQLFCNRLVKKIMDDLPACIFHSVQQLNWQVWRKKRG